MDLFTWGSRAWGSSPWGSTGPITNDWVPPSFVLRRLREQTRRIGVINERMSQQAALVRQQARVFLKPRLIEDSDDLNPTDSGSEP
jgi:hypothetical protein